MNIESRSAIAIAFGGLVALATAMGIGRFVYTPILPNMLVDLGMSKAEAGVIASANFLGYLVGALAAASPAFASGKRGWLIAALTVSALSTGAMAVASSIALFMGLRLIGGIASAFGLVFASALVLDRLAASGRSPLSAVHFAGVGCGIALSALLVSSLAAWGYGWRFHWLASGGISLLAVILVVRLIPAAHETPQARSTPPDSTTNRRLVSLIIAYGLFGFGYVITATFISTIVSSAPSLQAVEPIVWFVVGAAAIPSVALWTYLARQIGLEWGLALACLVEAAGVAMSVLANSAPAVVLAAALLGGTFMGITALGLVKARQLSVGDPRRNLALMTASFGLGQMIGPIFAGTLHGLGGSFLAPSLAASAALAIAAMLVLAKPSPRRSGG